MKTHLSTVVFALLFVLVCLAADIVRADYLGFSVESLRQTTSDGC